MITQRGPEFEKKEADRRFRRNIFYSTFGSFAAFVFCFLIWKLKALLLPIVVGALLAYLFRPLKDRFNKITFLPHELRVLTLFATIGFVLFAAGTSLKSHFPNEREKLVLKVRLRYKLNEKFQQVVGHQGNADSQNPLRTVIGREAGPAMDTVNEFLALTADEKELFLKYRQGYRGQPVIEDRFYDYFQATETTGSYTAPQPREPATHNSEGAISPPAKSSEISKREKSHLKESISAWMLAPLIFLFLGFDNGQMRRYLIGVIPNRYFEMSLTIVDVLDDAIGKYLRGTLIECMLVGLTLTIGFILLGIPFSVSVAIGAISGLANAIPFLGTVIGLIIGLGYALIAEGVNPLIPGLSPDDIAIYVVVLTVIAHVLDNVVFQPFVLGSAVNLHPLVVVVAIIGGSLMAGLWGMFLAIPTVVVLKTAVETLFKELKDYRII